MGVQVSDAARVFVVEFLELFVRLLLLLTQFLCLGLSGCQLLFHV
jgi:hypothetical protein